MGMSATQARYLSLIGRKNDIEFQGQQINQSRTTLSDQTNNLYSQLQNMTVPTPPNTQDYTTITYSTSDGAVKYTLGTIRPSAKSKGQYNLDMNYSTVGDSLTKNITSNSITYSDAEIKVSEVNIPAVSYRTAGSSDTATTYVSSTGISGDKIQDGESIDDYMIKDEHGNFIPASGEFEDNVTYYKKSGEMQDGYTGLVQNDNSYRVGSLENLYIVVNGSPAVLTEDCNYVTKLNDGGFLIDLSSGAKLYQQSASGEETIQNPNPGALLIGGKEALTYDAAKAKYGTENIDWTSYEAAIKHTFGDDAKLSDFYYVITPKGTSTYDISLFKIEDIPTHGSTVSGYKYASGTYTASQNYDYVDLEFDSTGRITKISYPTEFDDAGNPTQWKTLDVKASTTTNNEAYETAMAEYEYQKYKYDQEQTEINAQISIIQSQDKKLELKLQRLDNERQQITTEIEALDKVINDNIESSYKTFSG